MRARVSATLPGLHPCRPGQHPCCAGQHPCRPACPAARPQVVAQAVINPACIDVSLADVGGLDHIIEDVRRRGAPPAPSPCRPPLPSPCSHFGSLPTHEACFLAWSGAARRPPAPDFHPTAAAASHSQRAHPQQRVLTTCHIPAPRRAGDAQRHHPHAAPHPLSLLSVAPEARRAALRPARHRWAGRGPPQPHTCRWRASATGPLTPTLAKLAPALCLARPHCADSGAWACKPARRACADGGGKMLSLSLALPAALSSAWAVPRADSLPPLRGLHFGAGPRRQDDAGQGAGQGV